ncbi:tRNA pseudouridine(38-40) synthase TruA [Alkaliphilus serpentinus]|uniref:tRNA pseudouridine synthase A n=1 Tax=Alkaliphilus serpentinus TaxID=1482731 RepID=A0A833HR49_9FIRM|nr:tRNA pseudouridine(38-40) synthase TruA [Alkaliphilus serpentinus]KAB3532506.1 tRNA pseudouridine(38-40) synthase TruA [Alkaliphilus serpentinus]
MRNIRMVLEYDGARYRGWQRLKDSDKTIQGKLEAVISQMVERDTEVIGSGRTDAGVHAKGQVANFFTSSDMPLKEIQEYINHYLPKDIAVKAITEAAPRFNSRLNAIGKKYTYYIWNQKTPSVFQRDYSYHTPNPLDINKMKKASEKLLGTHDFLAFSSLKKSKKSTIRTIEEIVIEKNQGMLTISIKGDGFLYNMIRIIVGTLIDIGAGKEGIAYIDEIFKRGERRYAGVTAPAQGLFLEEVYYD